MKKILPILIMVAIIAAGGIYYLSRTTTAGPESPDAAAPIDEETALLNLQADMRDVAPHFIVPTWQQGQTLTSDEKKIEADVAALLSTQIAAAHPNNPRFTVMPGNDFWLNAIGTRHVLISQAGADSFNEAILDSRTGALTPIPGDVALYLAPERNAALYIGPQAIYFYSIDEASATLMPGSQLGGTETYHNGVGGLGIIVQPDETHTEDSISISVFDSTTSVPNPDGGTMYVKTGQRTLSF